MRYNSCTTGHLSGMHIDNIIQARSKQKFAGQAINVMHGKYICSTIQDECFSWK